MIYVLIWPKTFIEKLRYFFKNQTPSITCEKIRYGGGMVECQQGDSGTAVPLSRVMRIVWEGGYLEALASAKKEHIRNIRATFEGGCDNPGSECKNGEKEGPTPAEGAVPDGYG